MRRPLGVGFGALLLALGVGTDVACGQSARVEREGLDLRDGDRRRDVLVRSAGQRDFTIARLSPREIVARSHAEPATDLQFLPETHLTTDISIPLIGVPIVEAQGLTGKGVFVGVVDSGLDVAHPALRNEAGGTRVAWLLDYTRRTRGKYADAEATFGAPACLAKDDAGKAADGGECVADPRCSAPIPCAVTKGAVYAAADIDALLAALPAPPEPLPTDDEGHGTHAMGIAAGSRLSSTAYRGVATEARMIGVRVDQSGGSLDSAGILRGIQFVFDRADREAAPAVVNLSLTTDFVVRDGTDSFGPTIANLALAPGHIIVAASGNNGDPGLATHQTVSVAEGEQVRVPFRPPRAGGGDMAVIVSPHSRANVRVGCDDPHGRWVSPTERGHTRSAESAGAVANVVWNAADFHGRLPPASSSALVLMQGAIVPSAEYAIVLEGSGTVDMWITNANFESGVREQTVGSPAMDPGIIAVGAMVSRGGYVSEAGESLALVTEVFDEGGSVPVSVTKAPPPVGQVAAFSGAGPGPTGGIKPDILAPGVAILSAASSAREPGTSIFIGAGGRGLCPFRLDGTPTKDAQCLLVDAQHGAGTGTSFAAPFVTGAAAILLQVDPTLTEQEMRVALQAGAHVHRVPARFPESASVGELDLPGAVLVARRLRDKPAFVPPAIAQSWITVSASYVPSDGTRPLDVLVNLRGADGSPADGFGPERFAVSVESVNGRDTPRALRRLGPGLWEASFDVTPYPATSTLTVHATFNGAPVATPVTLPIALDPWLAHYPTSAAGASCASTPWSTERRTGGVWLALGLAVALARRRRRRS